MPEVEWGLQVTDVSLPWKHKIGSVKVQRHNGTGQQECVKNIRGLEEDKGKGGRSY